MVNTTNAESNTVDMHTPKRNELKDQNKISDFFPNRVTREKAIEFAVQVDDMSEESSDESEGEMDSTFRNQLNHLKIIL